MIVPTGPCPHCGEQTEGQHIAGTVYDYQCGRSCDEIDAGFRAFVDALLDDTLPELPTAAAGGSESNEGDQSA